MCATAKARGTTWPQKSSRSVEYAPALRMRVRARWVVPRAVVAPERVGVEVE